MDPDDSAKAAIHKASLQGHAAAVRRLVELGADLNLGSDSGSTPLHFAGAYGHLELVATLLELGADPTKQNEFGEDALHMANMKVAHPRLPLALLRVLHEEIATFFPPPPLHSHGSKTCRAGRR